MLTDEQARAFLTEVEGRHGRFECHDIQISENVWTGEDHGERLRHGRFVALVTTLYGMDLSGLKVLDLACLEGYSAIEFARRGATSIGIDIRPGHLHKARALASALSLDNVSFVEDDVRNVTAAKYGEFDIVICSGILYHLDTPDVFHFVRNIAGCCRRLMVIDTSFAMQSDRTVEFDGMEYHGRDAPEHNPGDDPETKRRRGWASIDNETSLYLTKPSLINLMTTSGLACVAELHMPFKYKQGQPRITLFGFKPSGDLSMTGSNPFAEEPWQKNPAVRRRAPYALTGPEVRAWQKTRFRKRTEPDQS